MAFEEIKAGLEKYMKDVEEKLMSRTKIICPRCGDVDYACRTATFGGCTTVLLCRICKNEVEAINKQLIAKGLVFKHGFEKKV